MLLTNSGSEATYAALRLARAVTGRNDIIKFQGTYHGWHDAVLMNVISKPERVGQNDPLSLGMLPEPSTTRSCSLSTMPRRSSDAAARPGRGDRGHPRRGHPTQHRLCAAATGFLARLRELADAHGVVLIFDEVITGFRHDLGGYQRIAGVTPDLTTFAKAMANGYPIAALWAAPS